MRITKDGVYSHIAIREALDASPLLRRQEKAFIKTVAEGRHMDEAAVRQLATGLTFTGLDSITNGLADELGTLEDAIAAKCAIVPTIFTVPTKSRSFWKHPSAGSPTSDRAPSSTQKTATGMASSSRTAVA